MAAKRLPARPLSSYAIALPQGGGERTVIAETAYAIALRPSGSRNGCRDLLDVARSVVMSTSARVFIAASPGKIVGSAGINGAATSP